MVPPKAHVKSLKEGGLSRTQLGAAVSWEGGRGIGHWWSLNMAVGACMSGALWGPPVSPCNTILFWAPGAGLCRFAAQEVQLSP
jgi:hypothetical protein